MRIRRWDDMTDDEQAALLARGLDAIFDPGLRASIVELIEDVRRRGDAAVCDALARFDGIDITPEALRVTDDEIEAARVDDDVDRAIDDAIAHVRAFNEQQRERVHDWSFESDPGLSVGEKITPIASAGLFTPSGKASYPSVMYQLLVPAIVAGVPRIVAVVPPIPDGRGEVDPAVLVVCRKLGQREVFRVNGPAGIAALGFGTESIPAVRKIVGPGSPAVTLAQVEMQRYGVATMMLLGPTESVVLADGGADPERLAADLLIEAEHGTDTSVVLLTTRAALGENGGAVVVDTLDEAVAIVNRYAPEHLQVAVPDDRVDDVVEGIVNAGEILIGQHTPFSAANFVIGCPASLPTSGFAHVSSGITAATFLKRTAVARADAAALVRLGPSVIALADHEGFPAHAAAIRRRQE